MSSTSFTYTHTHTHTHTPDSSLFHLSRLTAHDQRTLNIATYLSHTHTGLVAPLSLQPSVRALPWHNVFVQLHEHTVSPSKILYLLNGAFVALATVPVDPPPPTLWSLAGLSGITSHTPHTQTLACAVIRAIDPTRNLLYIASPLSDALFATVNVIVKGLFELPVKLLSEGTALRGPYLDPAGSATGSQRSKRHNLQRRKNDKL